MNVLLCGQEFYDLKPEGSELKKGFDESFFLQSGGELTISSEFMLDCIFFQRKVPESIITQLASRGLLCIDALGEKTFRALADCLRISIIYNLKCLRKFDQNIQIKEIKEIEVVVTDDLHYYLMIPLSEGEDFTEVYNLFFFLPRENLLQLGIRKIISKILEILYEALLENEFVLEKGSFEMAFLIYCSLKTFDLVKITPELKKKQQILQGFYCIIEAFRLILESYNESGNSEFDGILEKIFANSINYLSDSQLFLKDCEEIKKEPLHLRYQEIFFIYDEKKTFNWISFCSYFDVKKGDLGKIMNRVLEQYLSKNIKKASCLKINLKSQKFDSFRLFLKVISEFPYLNFI